MSEPTNRAPDCADHWPVVVLGPGGYPFIRCYLCPAVIPRAEASRSLLLDCASIIRGEPGRALEAGECAVLMQGDNQ